MVCEWDEQSIKTHMGIWQIVFFSEGWQEREVLALASDTILLATRCITQAWKLLIFFVLKTIKKYWAVV